MKHGLNVVSVGVQCERCVVARMVVAVAWLAVVATARCKGGLMESLDLVLSVGLECQVDA